MGRKRKGAALDVYVGSRQVGTYSRAPSGATSFRYDGSWLASKGAFPISLTMPLSDRVWSGMSVSSYFDGLLPDAQAVRDKIASREQAGTADTFDLLAAIGRDCVGALRFIPEGLDPGDPTKMTYRAIGDAEIAARLAALGSTPLGVAPDEEFRISIAGVQEKTAFLNIGQRWCLPLGATATSHIFKPAMAKGPYGADFSDMPWNEWLCLHVCRALGLNAANAQVLTFGGKPVLVVERFDRVWQEGVLYRLPQEDLCQALGVPPARKYQSDGGPGIVEVLNLLNGAESPYKDRLAFITAQIVFWLLAAIDGHAKNFSIFLTPGGYKLTPLYDVVSAAPYPQFSAQKTKLAMSMGDKGYYRIKQIQVRHFYQTAQAAGLRKQDLDDILEDLSSRLDRVIAETSRLAARANMPKATMDPILAGVKARGEMLSTHD